MLLQTGSKSGPLHRQLSEGLAELIDRGELPPYALLPPERSLAAALTMSRTTVVFDFGGVIGLGQPDGTLQALAAVADVDDERFTERYWRFREAYDLGMDAADYWTAVAGVPSLSPAVVQRLTDRDVECWTRLDRDTLDNLVA
ncbi:MAG: GntR family transcriptional regulator, partial [Actinobacteria bacterium]|nr:GntR family transcriptional regulator [Actinomycetota bacterium]